jgi:hypothetical protein
VFGKTNEKVLFLSVERLVNFNLKLLFRMQMTKKDLIILLSYSAIFQMLTNCNNNNNILLLNIKMIIIIIY